MPISPLMPGLVATARFEPELATPPRVRAFIAATLADWGLAHLSHDVQLVATELATNVILHARTEFSATVRRVADGLRLEVCDTGPGRVEIPATRPAVEALDGFNAVDDLDLLEAALLGESMGGRGLRLVADVVDAWGVVEEDGQKTVWAEFRTGRADSPSAAGPGDTSIAGVRKRPVRVVAVPVRLALESEANIEDVQRELEVLTAPGSERGSDLSEILVSDVLRLLEATSSYRQSVRDAARDALSEGKRLVDAGLFLPPDAPAYLWQLAKAMEEVAENARAGNLLSPPPRDEVMAFRQWLANEIEHQVRGAIPDPCPFPIVPGDEPRAHSGPPPEPTTVDHEERLHCLQEALIALSSATTAGEVAEIAIGAAASGLTAVNGSVALLQPDGLTVEIVAAVGYPESVRSHWAAFPVSGDLPASEAIRIRKPILLPSSEELGARYPVFRSTPVVGSEAVAVVPLIAGPTLPLGALALGFAGRRSLEDDLDFLLALASAAAAALKRVGDAADAEIHAERSAFLRRVEAQVGGAENRLDVAARFSSAAIPMLGDWVGMYLLGAEGDYLAAGVAHANREKQDLARMVQERWPPKPESSAIGAAFQTGEEFVFQVVPDEALAQSAEDEEHLAALRQLGIGAGMILPVWEDDEVIAVASFANEPGRHVTEADRHLAVSALALVAAAMTPLPKP